MKAPSFALLLAGFVVWSGAFLLLYAVQATGCHLGWHQVEVGPSSALRLLLVAIFLLVLTLLVWLVWHTKAQQNRLQTEEFKLLLQIAVLLQLAALCATMINYGGVLWLTLC
jgi:ABC-type xylose transport system permease subunit